MMRREGRDFLRAEVTPTESDVSVDIEVHTRMSEGVGYTHRYSATNEKLAKWLKDELQKPMNRIELEQELGTIYNLLHRFKREMTLKYGAESVSVEVIGEVMNKLDNQVNQLIGVREA